MREIASVLASASSHEAPSALDPLQSAVASAPSAPSAPSAGPELESGRPTKKKGRPKKDPIEEPSEREDPIKKLSEILPKLMQMEAKLSELEEAEDFEACADVKRELSPLRKDVAALPLCSGCFIERPTARAQAAIKERWHREEQGQWTCARCKAAAGKSTNTTFQQRREVMRGSLHLRVMRELAVAQEVLENSDHPKAELRKLQLCRKNLKMCQQDQEQMQLSLVPARPAAAAAEVEAPALVGQLCRTSRRLSLESGSFVEHRKCLDQALECFNYW